MVFRPEWCSIERRSGVMRWRVLVVDWVDAAIPRRRPTGSSSRGVQKCDGGGEHGPEDFGDHGGPEVPEGLDEPEDSEPVAAQVFWEEPSDDGWLAGLGEADAQTAEHENDQQDGPPVLLPGEHPVAHDIDGGPRGEHTALRRTLRYGGGARRPTRKLRQRSLPDMVGSQRAKDGHRSPGRSALRPGPPSHPRRPRTSGRTQAAGPSPPPADVDRRRCKTRQEHVGPSEDRPRCAAYWCRAGHRRRHDRPESRGRRPHRGYLPGWPCRPS